VVIDLDSLIVLFIVQAPGSVHDFTLYKESTGSAVSSDIEIKVDSGYQGIATYHANSEVPFKKTKNRPLLSEEKAFNRQLARERIAIEHVNREIKIFKIMSDRYRNRRKRHGLRMTLICAVRNREINHNKG
jgi:transposase